MIVLVWSCRIRILSAPQSLKEKRSVVRRVLEKARRDFRFSAAEVGDHDLLNAAHLGLCTVGTDGAVLEAAVERCRGKLEAFQPIEFFQEEISLEHY